MSNYELKLLNALFELDEADHTILTKRQYTRMNILLDKAVKLNLWK
jgi:hypothetical protein